MASFSRIFTGMILAIARPGAFSAALPFLVAWIAAPAIVKWISTPATRHEIPQASPGEEQVLRLTARRTWRYFDQFVTEEDHWLPPDNFQEDPKPVVAHRTSPTNMGLGLLAVLSANDLGWIGVNETVERLEKTFETLSQMELYRGHFYNWYETNTLRPLDPKYISSVDSGNLAGHLLTLSAGCRELLAKPFPGPALLAGLRDTIALLREPLAEIGESRRSSVVTRRQLTNAVDAIAAELDVLPANPVSLAARLSDVRTQAQNLADIARTFALAPGGPQDELGYWAEALSRCIESHWRDAQILCPWTQFDPRDISNVAAGAAEWSAIEPLLNKVPKLFEAPQYFESVAAELAALPPAFVQRVAVGNSGPRSHRPAIKSRKAFWRGCHAVDGARFSRRRNRHEHVRVDGFHFSLRRNQKALFHRFPCR